MSSIVKANSNITHQVIEHIIHLYSFFSGTLHKIQKSLKEEHKIEISHQSIENIILFSNYELNIENWTLSGYYIFDALWVKKDGNWWYLICLFDVKINTIVLRSLVKSESSDIIRDFIAKSLRNQKKKCITTDLKHEYHIALNQLKINQQFCLFHSKQKINRDIKEHVDENKLNEEKIDEIIFYKKLIFEIFDAESLDLAKTLRDNLMKEYSSLPLIIQKIMMNFIIPYFKNLTYYLVDKNVESTSNKLEIVFLKILTNQSKKCISLKREF